MYPVLFRLGRFGVFTYGALVALGGALSCWLWYSKRERMGLQRQDDFWLLINALLLGGFIGGRVLFIVEYVPFRPAELVAAAFTLNKGFSVLGAFAGVIGAVWLVARSRKVAFLRLLDYICLVAPLWHAFGRLGCFAAGCCFGRPASLPWAVRFTDRLSMVDRNLLGVPLHPTQLYEAAGNLGLFLALRGFVLPLLEDRRLSYGVLSGLYFAAYGVLRFGIEFYRGDAVPGLVGLSAGQGLCLLLLACGLALVAWARRQPCIPY